MPCCGLRTDAAATLYRDRRRGPLLASLRRFRCTLFTACLLVTATAWSAEPDAFRLDGFSWHGPVAAGAVIDVDNRYGQIRSRAAQDGQVHVLAAIQRFAPIHDHFTVRVGGQPERLQIEVVLDAEGPVGKGRVDLAVLLPPETTLEARTVDGLIKVKRFASALRARTESGAIKIVSEHPVRAHTRDGRIEAKLPARAWTGESALRSDSGSIRVQLARDASLELVARSGGALEADLDGAFTAGVERADGHLSVVLGQGGGRLTVESASGDVTISTVQVPRVAQ